MVSIKPNKHNLEFTVKYLKMLQPQIMDSGNILIRWHINQYNIKFRVEVACKESYKYWYLYMLMLGE